MYDEEFKNFETISGINSRNTSVMNESNSTHTFRTINIVRPERVGSETPPLPEV